MKIHIDYDRLIAYANEKGVPVPELTDDEKNRFILNSTMDEIKKIRHLEFLRTGIAAFDVSLKEMSEIKEEHN